MSTLYCVAVDQDRFEWIIDELEIEVIGTETFGRGTYYSLKAPREELIKLANLYYMPCIAKSTIESIDE